jgi:hypothetical protein
MASFVREAGSDLTPAEHSAQIWRDSLKLMSLKGLLGAKGSGNVIVVDNMLQNNAGDTIDYHFVPYADKQPIKGQDATIQGNEYSFSEYSTQLTIDEVNFPFKKRGKMTDQRSILDVRAELGRQIAQHNAQYNEDQLFKVMSGGGVSEALSALQDSTDTTDRVNGASRCIAANGASSFTVTTEAASDNTALFAAVTATDKISPALIKRAAVMARTSSPYKMQPLRVGPNNAEFFILYLSLEAAYDLTEHPDWITHALSTTDMNFGDDPIATNSLGVFGNVIVKESERIIKVTNGTRSIARNLLMGADAAVLGFSQTLDLQEQWNDYRRELGVNGSEIRGEVKLAFTDKDSSATNDTTADIDYGIAQVITASD